MAYTLVQAASRKKAVVKMILPGAIIMQCPECNKHIWLKSEDYEGRMCDVGTLLGGGGQGGVMPPPFAVNCESGELMKQVSQAHMMVEIIHRATEELAMRLGLPDISGKQPEAVQHEPQRQGSLLASGQHLNERLAAVSGRLSQTLRLV